MDEENTPVVAPEEVTETTPETPEVEAGEEATA
jgi:hypothetical protein